MIIKNNSLDHPSTPLRSPSSEGRPSSEGSDDNSLAQAFGFVARTMTSALDDIAPGLSGAMHPLFNNPVVDAVKRRVSPALREAGHQALVLNTKGFFMDLDPMKEKALERMKAGDEVGANRIVAAMERYQNAEKKQRDALTALQQLYPAATTIPLQLDYSESNPLVKRWMQTYRPCEPKIDALRALPVVSVFRALEQSTDAADRETAAHIRTAMDSLIEPNYPPYESIEDLDRVTDDINAVFGSPHVAAFVGKVRESQMASWMENPSFRNRAELGAGLRALEALGRLPGGETDEGVRSLVETGEKGVVARLNAMMPEAGLEAFRLFGRLREIAAMPTLAGRVTAYRELTNTLDTAIFKNTVATNLAAYREMKKSVATSDRVLNGIASISGFHPFQTTSGFDAMIARYEKIQALLNDGKPDEARAEFAKIESASLVGELKDNYEASGAINAGAGVGVVLAAALGMEQMTAVVGPELIGLLGAGAGKAVTFGAGVATFRALHNYLDSKLQDNPSLFYNANRSLFENVGSFTFQSSKDFAMFLTLGAALGRFESFADARKLGAAARALGGFGTEVTALQGFTAVTNAIEAGRVSSSVSGTLFSGDGWFHQAATLLGIKVAGGLVANPLKAPLWEVVGLARDGIGGAADFLGRLREGARGLLAGGAPEAARGGVSLAIDEIDAADVSEIADDVQTLASLSGRTPVLVKLPSTDSTDMNYTALLNRFGMGRRPSQFLLDSNTVAFFVTPTEVDGIRAEIRDFAEGLGGEVSQDSVSGEITILAQPNRFVPAEGSLTPETSAEDMLVSSLLKQNWKTLGAADDFQIGVLPNQPVSVGDSHFQGSVVEISWKSQSHMAVMNKVGSLLSDAGFEFAASTSASELVYRTAGGETVVIRVTGMPRLGGNLPSPSVADAPTPRERRVAPSAPRNEDMPTNPAGRQPRRLLPVDLPKTDLAAFLVDSPALKPTRAVTVGGRTFFLGPVVKTEGPEGDRLFAFGVVPVTKNGQTSLQDVAFYRSHSDGGWRALPYTMGARFAKGRIRVNGGAESGHYTQETQLMPELSRALEEAATGSTVTMPDADVMNLTSVTSPLRSDRGSDVLSAFEEGVAVVEPDSLAGVRRFRPGQAFHWNDGEKPAGLEDRLWNILRRNAPSTSDLRAISYPEGFIPDFQKGPVRRSASSHTLLGETAVSEYEARLDGRPVVWTMEEAAGDRVWIRSIRFADAGVSDFGTTTEVIDSGILTSKPVEYTFQLGNLPAAYRRPVLDGQGNASHYEDITAFLSKLEPIRLYRAARGN